MASILVQQCGLLAALLLMAGGPPTARSHGDAASPGRPAADSVPSLDNSDGDGGSVAWRLRRESVVEGAWSPAGAGALQVVTAGVEVALPGGVQARLDLMGKWGHDGLRGVPAQGHSSFDAEDFGGAGEAWLEWTAAEGLRVRVGTDVLSPFAGVAVSGDGGAAHLTGGLAASPYGVPLDTRLGAAASLVTDPVEPDELVAEVFVSFAPWCWVRVQPDLQVRFARGRAPAPAGLLRLVVTP